MDKDDGTFEIAEVPVAQGSNDLVVRVTDVSGNTATQVVGVVKESLGAARFYDHDANGNLVAEVIAEGRTVSTNEYVWDRENRLAKVLHNGSVVEECWYDGMGRRLAKREVVNGQTNEVQYLWDGWSVVAVLDGQGGLLEFYTRGLGIAGDIGTIVAETRFSAGSPTNTYYYHCNHRGDITTVRSGTNTVAEYDYAPFGEVRSYSGSYSARFRFSSKEYDQASGLCYFGYRHYSPSLGRWLVVDPFADNILIHEFAYSENSPLRYVDASGGAAVDVLPSRNSPPRRIRIKPREPRTLMPRYEPIPGRAHLSLGMCIAECWESDAATPSGVVPDIVQRCARAPNPGNAIPTWISLLGCIRDCLTPVYRVNGLGPWYSWGDPFPVPDVEVDY